MAFESNKKLKTSGIIFSIVFLVIFVLLPYIFRNHLNITPIFISLLISFISLLRPSLLKYPYKGWIKFGEILSRINSKLILALFFYIIITPAAILRSIIKKFTRKTRTQNTFYSKVGQERINSNFTDQY